MNIFYTNDNEKAIEKLKTELLGKRVRINACQEYNHKYAGCAGTVVRVSSKHIVGIKLDNISNERSKYDAYWFSTSSFHLFEGKEGDVRCWQQDDTAEGLTEYHLVAGVTFLNEYKSGAPKHFYRLYDNNIDVGDLVAVNTCNHGLALAYVSCKCYDPVDKVFGSIRGKVDETVYNAAVEKETQMYKDNAKAKRIKALVDKIASNFNVADDIIYEMAAEHLLINDADFTKLCNEMKEG